MAFCFSSEEAGWFQEAHSNPDKFGKEWAMTPIHKLLNPNGNNDIILLSTGGFAPIHDGHVSMMEAAKTYMESKGFHIRGGYVSPGHDDYVVKHKNIKLFAPQRLAITNDKLKDHPWLMVDPWEAIGCSCSVNFTTVINHLETLLNCRVCYVVGSDNARFSLAFQDHGLICIVRRTSDVLPNPKYKDRVYSNSSDHVYIADNKPIPGSSTTVRNESNILGIVNKRHLILRVDELSESYLENLLSILKDYYLSVKVSYVKEQTLPIGIDNLISLDQMICSSFGNLGISRNYIEGGYYKIGYINRPGTPRLDEQVKKFSGKTVSLFDDDMVTGNTMKEVISFLEKVNCKVESYHTLTSSNDKEIMDSRDFLPILGGGLVVNGKRVPYIYPHVCPYVRASILPEQAEEFSERIRLAFWKADL